MISRLRAGAHFDIIRRARTWFIISGILIVLSLGSLAVRRVNAGLEFRGGTDLQVESGRNGATVADVDDALAKADIEQPTIQRVGARGFRIQTEHLDARTQRRAVDAVAKELNVPRDEVNVTDVGPKWGAQITSKAIRALIVFLFVVVIYLSIRLEPKMALSAMIALVHDMIITAGVYSLSGFEVTPATVIALLTILGYSLYDTVVIFDRVKDRTASLSAAGRVTYTGAANDALNQVLLRSINTSIVSLLPVGSLLFVGSFLLGAQTLRELALALFVGIAAGAYSSVFIATPALALLKEREPRWAALRVRIAGRTTETPIPPRMAPAAPMAEPMTTASPTSAPTAVAEASRRPSGSKPQRRKRKKHGRR